MLLITKIFYFELAHAIEGYSGACKDIHGHSYELHVTVSGMEAKEDYFPNTGFFLDFKELKLQVAESILKKLDHKLVLSKNYILNHPEIGSHENLVVLEAEPSAENLLIYIRRILKEALSPAIKLFELKLFETKDSYTRWIDNNLPPHNTVS